MSGEITAPALARPRRLRLLVGASLIVVAVVVVGVVAVLALTGGDDAAVGERWSRVVHDQAAFGGSRIVSANALARGGPGLVAVGSDAEAPNANAVDQDSQFINGVAAGANGLVAAGIHFVLDPAHPFGGDFDAAVWTSPDGESWERLDDSAGIFSGPSYEEGRGPARAIPELVGLPSKPGHDRCGGGSGRLRRRGGSGYVAVGR